MVVTLRQQYNVGEKPTVLLYTYINRRAELPNITSLNTYPGTWYNKRYCTISQDYVYTYYTCKSPSVTPIRS